MMTAFAMALAAVAAQPCPAASSTSAGLYRTSFGGVLAGAREDADRAIAAGDVARKAARRFLDIDLPPFLIATVPVGSDLPTAGCGFVFPWPAGRKRGEARPLPSHVLPHEIGHAVFIRFVVPRTVDDEYGGDAPDWLDEMAAMAFEDADGIRMRRSEARRHAAEGRLIPLRRLLSMTHPDWQPRKREGEEPSPAGTRQPKSTDTPAFYATVRALFDLLIDRTKDERVIPMLVTRLRSGVPIATWLPAVIEGRNSPSDLARADAHLRAFVLDDPAFATADDADPHAGGGR